MTMALWTGLSADENSHLGHPYSNASSCYESIEHVTIHSCGQSMKDPAVNAVIRLYVETQFFVET
jgi:hypothetical protein